MAGPQPIEWRRRPPFRDLGNFGWYGVIAVLAVACVWLLFGDEPAVLDGGGTNPLVELPQVVTVLAAAGAVPMMMPVLRRPVVAANDQALVVRPGALRTLDLPWAAVAEVSVRTVGHERFLLIRLRTGAGVPGPRPSWIDQGALRRLRRTDVQPATRHNRVGRYDRWATFDLAVPMVDFVGGAQAGLVALAAFAPDTVVFSTE